MAQIVIPVVSLLVPTATTLLHTVPSTDEQTLTLTANNQTSSEKWISLWLVPEGGTAVDANKRITQLAIPAYTPIDLFREIPLTKSSLIYVAASVATSIAVQLTGRKRLHA